MKRILVTVSLFLLFLFGLVCVKTSWAHIDVMGGGTFELTIIRKPGETGSHSSHLLIAKTNQPIRITIKAFRFTRQETGTHAEGTDTLSTVFSGKFYGKNAFIYNNLTADEFNNLTTPVIHPAAGEEVFMDLTVEASSSRFSLDRTHTYDKSSDAGRYTALVKLIVETAGPPPSPPLEFVPDKAWQYNDSQNDTLRVCVRVKNKSLRDPAQNVKVRVKLRQGERYADLSYNPRIGDIPAGEEKRFCFTLDFEAEWKKADSGRKIIVSFVSDPEGAEGRYTITKKK